MLTVGSNRGYVHLLIGRMAIYLCVDPIRAALVGLSEMHAYLKNRSADFNQLHVCLCNFCLDPI